MIFVLLLEGQSVIPGVDVGVKKWYDVKILPTNDIGSDIDGVAVGV